MMMQSPAAGESSAQGRDPRALSPVNGRGAFVALSLMMGVALVIVAIGVNGARDDRSWGETLYWGGLLLLVIPCAVRLAGSSASRRERLSLIVLLGLALLAVECFVDPLGFNNHDEFGHLRETYDIISTGHLFGFNPIQTEYTYFPGIEIATSTFAHFSGLSILVSWRIVAAALRIVEVLALFLIIERATASSRVAGLGVLIYMCNPSFVYFDAHFSYESFALPLGFLLVQRATAVEADSSRVGSWVLFMLVLAALTVSHHLAAYIIVGILVLLALAERIWGDRRSPLDRARGHMTGLFAVVALAAVSAWALLAAPTTISKYLGPVLSEAVSSTVGLATGARAAEKTLFEAQNKQAAPLLEQAIGFAAVGLLVVLLLWGLWRLWRSHRLSSPLPAALVCVAVIYPPSLLFRLTLNGSETSNRASAYVYLGLAYVVAAGVLGIGRSREPPQEPTATERSARRRLPRLPVLPAPVWSVAVALAVALLLIGGITVGTDRTERLPGPYYPAVTARAASDPESIAAANWVGGHLTPHQALFSDIVNRLLMSSYGRENTVCCYVDDQLLPELFLTPTFTAKDAKLIRLFHIRLVVVDQRLDKPSLSTHLFFERSDGGPYYKPLSPLALAKFARVASIDQLFDSGNIAIYDTAKIATGSAPATRAGGRRRRGHRRVKAARYRASKAGATRSDEKRAASIRAALPRRLHSSGLASR